MEIRFFMPMQIPSMTAQQKGINFDARKVYTKKELLAIKQKYLAYLAPHRPEQPIKGPICLNVDFCYPAGKTHQDGEWKKTKPDTDNAVKLLKDCMTQAGFWKDDSQVALETVAKYYTDNPQGIYIEVLELVGGNIIE